MEKVLNLCIIGCSEKSFKMRFCFLCCACKLSLLFLQQINKVPVTSNIQNQLKEKILYP